MSRQHITTATTVTEASAAVIGAASASHETAETFVVRLPGPLDIPASLELFRRSGDDLLDRWDGAVLVRTLPVNGRTVAFACDVTGTRDEPGLRVHVADAADVSAIVDAVRTMFVPAPPEFAVLVARDPVLAVLDARHPGLRPVRQHELFAALVRCISAQQVNLRWAATTRRRLAEAFGARHVVAGHVVYSLPAARFAGVAVEEIRALQFTTRKAEYILASAEAVASGRLSVERLAELADEEAVAELAALRGIGRWTAEWILARTLGRPRVVAGDLGVRKAVAAAYLGWQPRTPLPGEEAIRQATAHWASAANVAQALVLQGYGSRALAT
jgi:DNA-3-methyladenine glycosylase II